VFVMFAACDVFKCTLFIVVNFVLVVQLTRHIEIGLLELREHINILCSCQHCTQHVPAVTP
jgi:hypothetical protein